jgi:beta-N-acetylhexosaminidase
MAARAAIFGLAGPRLAAEERAFFREADPWGFILFARNVEAPGQLRALVSELREAVGRAAPVLIDQEGGAVQRLRAPHWREWGPARALFEGPHGAERLRLRMRLVAAELAALGIDVNCAPMLDVPGPGAHPVVTGRVLGATAEEVAARGAVVADALLAGGVLPVLKHFPGHGRAREDSHEALPVVDAPLEALEAVDFAPFRALAHHALGMTAHVVYPALDPDAPATLSPACIAAIRGRIGFDGLLMTDDLSMCALGGPMGARARAALAAGCDVILHCNGGMAEMAAIAAEAPALAGEAAARAARAGAARRPAEPFDEAAAEARLAALAEAAA